MKIPYLTLEWADELELRDLFLNGNAWDIIALSVGDSVSDVRPPL